MEEKVMAMNQAFLSEFDHEMAGVRKTLERIPEEKFDWAPHPRSAKLGRLAQHLAEVPGWTKETLEKDGLNMGGYQPAPPPKTKAEVLALFDKNVAAARAVLTAANDDAVWMQPWSLKDGEHVIFSMPKVAVLRSFVFSHAIHHRAQMGVYLRMNNIAVPALYGPSADEDNF
jgi:uncharacterized damage-inducible protein DinB